MNIKADLKFKESGRIFFDNCRYENAIDDFKKYLALEPNDVVILSLLGDSFSKIGEKREALKTYRRVLEIDPRYTATLINLSNLILLAPNYLQVLKSIHYSMCPEGYIEIGVCKGGSFNLVEDKTVAVGIDPEPQLETSALPDNHVIVSDTSDNYFENGRIEQDFGGKSFDMAFLDGMHLFEFALRDFINLEKYSHPDSVVFVHDLYPMNAETATRERNSDFWSGDVWKLVLCLQEYRPDLGVEVLPCPPTGLGYITKLDASSMVLTDKYDEILEKYVDMSFDVIESDREQKLSLVGLDHPLLNL